MEDLDTVASRSEHIESQLRDLAAIGIDWDGEVVHQSTRRAQHDTAIAHLTAAGLTYPCWCTRREVLEASSAPHGAPTGAYPGTCRDAPARDDRPAALRLRADHDVRVVVHDRVHGPFDGLVDDLVLRRNDGTPSYNLAVVVDDADQGIEEVVRGDDLLPSTPRQVHLATLLDLQAPAYAHVPLVLGADGRRLAKRHASITLHDLAAQGTSPADVRSMLAASVGLAAPGERVSTEQLVARFDPDALPRDPWVLPG